MSVGVIDKEAVNSIPYYKESPLVQKAIADLETIMEKEKGMESRTEPMKNGKEQAEITKQSGKPAQQMEAGQDMERRRK